MAASKSKKGSNSTSNIDDQFVDVLYQKLGDNWFAFSLIDDDVFMSPITEEKITEIRNVESLRSNEAT